MQALIKAVFIDRDGTINVDHSYIKDPGKVEIIEKVPEALDLLQKKGFKLFIVSNQSGVGRGLMTYEEMMEVNNKVLELLNKNYFTETLICPHSPEANCECRKPKTKLVTEAAGKYNIDLSASYTIGDKDSDKELGIRMGGTGIKTGEKQIKSLYDAAKLIIRMETEL